MNRIIHYHNRIIFATEGSRIFLKYANSLTFEGENEGTNNDMLYRLHDKK